MRPILTIAAFSFALAAGGAAMAQPPGGAPPGGGGGPFAAMRAACQADMQKFCPDKQGPERGQCMQSHQSELSDQCKTAMAQMRAMRQSGGPPPSSAPAGQ